MGKIYTIGSSRELRNLLMCNLSLMLEEAENENGRWNCWPRSGIIRGQVVTIPGTNYVAANVVRKTDSDRS
jgi:hypothetical protein